MLAVVVEDNLRKINIGNWLNLHFQFPYIFGYEQVTKRIANIRLTVKQ